MMMSEKAPKTNTTDQLSIGYRCCLFDARLPGFVRGCFPSPRVPLVVRYRDRNQEMCPSLPQDSLLFLLQMLKYRGLGH